MSSNGGGKCGGGEGMTGKPTPITSIWGMPYRSDVSIVFQFLSSSWVRVRVYEYGGHDCYRMRGTWKVKTKSMYLHIRGGGMTDTTAIFSINAAGHV